MRLEQIYYFTKTAEMQSISKAAANLFITQQALSISIKNLENELGTTLLIRNRGGVVLTEEGEYFYHKAIEVLSAVRDIKHHFSCHFSQTQDESLTVALNENIKKYHLPPVVSFFKKHYPETIITYLNVTNEEVVDLVANNEVDIGLLILAEVDKKYHITLPKDVSFTPFVKYIYNVQVNKNSSLAQFRTLSLQTISKYPIILNQENQYDLFSKIIYQFNEAADIMVLESSPLVTHFLKDDLGVAIVPQGILAHDDDIMTIPISNNFKTYSGYLLSSKAPKSALLSLFTQKVLELRLK